MSTIDKAGSGWLRTGGRFHILTLTFFLACAISGCSRRGTDSARSNDTLRYPLPMEMATFDPAVNEAADVSDVLQNVFEGLTTLDEQTKPVSCLAEKWEISADGKTYTFHLNQKARFHPPFERRATASDVKYSMERALWPETRATILPLVLEDIVGAKEALAGKRRDVPGIKALDESTVAITLVGTRGYFLMNMAQPMVVCREAIQKNGGRLDHNSAIGTGPYRVAEYRANSRVILEAVPGYYRGAPKMKRIERPIVLDPQTVHGLYESDSVDLCAPAFQDFIADQRDPSLKAESKIVNAAGVNYLVMHPRNIAAFKDPRVRRAVSMAIDRDEINRVAYHNLTKRADTFLAPGVLGYDPGIPRIPYDPAGAQKLLAEAGFPGGRGFPKLTLVYRQQVPEIESAVQIIRDNLRKNLGITISLQAREAATFFADLDKETVPFHVVRWLALDPHDYLSLLLRTGARYNTVGYSNPRFDALCDRGDAELNPQKRAEYYRQADRIAMQDIAVLPINYVNNPYLIKPRVKGLQTNLGGLMPHYKTHLQR